MALADTKEFSLNKSARLTLMTYDLCVCVCFAMSNAYLYVLFIVPIMYCIPIRSSGSMAPPYASVSLGRYSPVVSLQTKKTQTSNTD